MHITVIHHFTCIESCQALKSGFIGAGSCNGVVACSQMDGNSPNIVGEGSCNGCYACHNVSGKFFIVLCLFAFMLLFINTGLPVLSNFHACWG